VTVRSILDGSRPRTFGLSAQGATYVLFTEQDLIVYQYCDVLVVPRSNLASASGEALELSIDDVATPPPAPRTTARVSTVLASSGVGFVTLDNGQRKRLAQHGGPRVTVGETIVVDGEEDLTISYWHRLGQEPQPLAPGKRCFQAVPSDDIAKPVGTARTPAMDVPPIAIDPVAAFCTSIDYEASLIDGDTEEDIHEVDALRALAGRRERSGDVLPLLFDREIAPHVRLVAVIPVLRFDESRADLRFSFEFYSNTEPSAEDRSQMIAVAQRLVEGGWGSGYEFDPPEDFDGCHVSIGAYRGA
jgi:hypothetical protein